MSKINTLKEYLLVTPNDNFLQHALALEYVKIGDDEAAKATFENLLANDANYVGSYYQLGKLYERLGHTTKAINQYKQGIQIAILAKDKHSHNELQAALEEIEGDE